MVKKFRCSTCGHSYDQPNPPIVDYTETKKQENDKSKEEEEEELKLKRELIEKLTCGITKQNIFDDKICLGYPLLIKRDGYGRL
jgi:DNA-directed RNA polymerase subunit M/transcription elongation factor TFIIS